MFPFMHLAVLLKLTVALFDIFVTARQYRRCHPAFRPSNRVAAFIPHQLFLRSQHYCRARTAFQLRVSTLEATLDAAATLLYLFPTVWAFAVSHAPQSQLNQTVLFFAVLAALSILLDLPPAFYSACVLDAAFGRPSTDPVTFMRAFLEDARLSVLTGIPMVAGLHYFLVYTAPLHPVTTAVVAFLALSVASVFGLYVYPVLLAPYCLHTQPLQDVQLEQKILAVAQRLDFPVRDVVVTDEFGDAGYAAGLGGAGTAPRTRTGEASRGDAGLAARTAAGPDAGMGGCGGSFHSHCFVMGASPQRSVCISASLLRQTAGQHDQIVSLLVHEIAHWWNGHLVPLLLCSLTTSLLTSVVYAGTARNADLFQSFGFDEEVAPVVGLLLVNSVVSPLDDVLSPVQNYVSRRAEFEADAFVKRQGLARQLGEALFSMSMSSTICMAPDDLYCRWNYPHPTLMERLDALGVAPRTRVGVTLERKTR